MSSNFCYDKCWNNSIPRETIIEGHREITRAKSGKNKRLCCDAGYKQTVNSIAALRNSEKNGTRICPNLREFFANIPDERLLGGD